MGLLALLIAFLIPFPGTLFNKTVEANYAEIRGWVAGMRRRWNGLLDALAVGPLGGVRRWLGPRVGGRTGMFLFLALSALVYGFLSPSFGLNSSSLRFSWASWSAWPSSRLRSTCRSASTTDGARRPTIQASCARCGGRC